MKDCLFRAMMAAAIIPAIATAQHNPQIAGDGHPDLSGTWAGAGGLATALKRVSTEKSLSADPIKAAARRLSRHFRRLRPLHTSLSSKPK